MKIKLMLGAAAIAMPLLAYGQSAQATAPVLPTTVVGSWQMNEAPGSTVMIDSSGHHYNGTIGSKVTTNGAYHTIPPVLNESDNFVKDHSRLDIIDSPASLSALNPTSADWSVTVRARWTSLDGDINMTQKGQGLVAGGRWHLSTPVGHIKCVYVDANRAGAEVDSRYFGQPNLADNQWHIITCAKVSGALQLVIDGKTVDVGTKKLGPITNNTPMTVGGKLHCKCDYWSGQVDWIMVQSG